MADGSADERRDVGLRITSATEPPRQVPVILQYALLACTLCAVIGSAVMYATDR
jgi:hypothetical protein